MFGRMLFEPILQVAPDSDAQTAVATLIQGCRKRRDRSLDGVPQFAPPVPAGTR